MRYDPTTKALSYRRPLVRRAMVWLFQASMAVPRLDATSMQLFGRICVQSWKVLDEMRAVDATAPATVDDQLALARCTAAFRHIALTCGATYPQARGRVALRLGQPGITALQLLEAYDPVTQGAAVFDTQDTLARLIGSARFRQ